MPQRSARRKTSRAAGAVLLLSLAVLLLASACDGRWSWPWRKPIRCKPYVYDPETTRTPPHPPLPERWTEPDLGIEMILVPRGELAMGSPLGEPGREAQETLHPVWLSRPYYLGRYEVTQEQWERVMGTRPSHFAGCGPDCPVESVSALDIERFLLRLKEKTGLAFRLPTEAEWENACRAGSPLPYSTGAHLTPADANIDGRPAELGLLRDDPRFRGRPTPVGSFPANAWGFHDLHGNVWEWVRDRHCPYPDEIVKNPLGACDSPHLVIRGGSWYYGADSARCGLRYTHRPQDSGPSLGFRLAFTPGPGTP